MTGDPATGPYDREAAEHAANRVPPHSPSLERALLGLMLITSEPIDIAITEGLGAGTFYLTGHQNMADTIFELHAAGAQVDAYTVADAMAPELLELLGGRRAIADIQAGAGYASAAQTYALLLLKHKALRGLISVGYELTDLGFQHVAVDAADTLDRAEQKLFDVTDEHRNGARRGVSPARDTMSRYLDELEAQYEQGDDMVGLPTGFLDYDNIVLGYRKTSLNIVAARPGMGKSSWALTVAATNAVTFNVPVLFFSLEMSETELMQRLVSIQSRIDGNALQRGRLEESDWDHIARVTGEIAEAPLYIDDTPDLGVFEIRAAARRVIAEQGRLGVIVVDYIQLMRGRSGAENRQVEMSEISRGLTLVARDLGVPVVALSQLNRGLELRQDKRPLLSDLRETGALEQDASTVTFIFRDEEYNPDSPDRGMAEIIVAKNRHGATGTAKLAWLPQHTRFANLGRSQDQGAST